MAEARASLAAVLVADPDDIALTHSTTDGINLTVSSLAWAPGDRVLTTNHEHPGVLGPLQALHDRLGVEVEVVDVGDAFCYGNSYGVPGHCHRFALTVRSPGTLEVTLIWPNSRPDVVLDVVRPGGLPCAKFSWPGGSRHELAMPADAGSTYEIRVVDDGRASPLNYELTTVLR
jgi:hypothetical protein